MSKHSFVDIFSQDECSHYVNLIDELGDSWTKRQMGNYYYYTLGLSSLYDVSSNIEKDKTHLEKIKNSNMLLKTNFLSIYNKIIKVISDQVGESSLIIEQAPIPGFFIYGEPKPNNIKKSTVEIPLGIGDIHTDLPVEGLDYIWSQYKEVADECISFTLPIEMPEYGSGLLLWDQPDMGCYSKNDISNIYKHHDYSQDERNMILLNSKIKNKIPEFIEHVPGRMLLQEGEQWHAATFSTKPLSTDRRITLQGMGVKCDGIWRLFF